MSDEANLIPEEKLNNTSDTKESNHTEEFKPWDMDLNEFCMFMHLAQFAGFILPFANIVLPIIMWFTNKDKSEIINQHGKYILNWMISSFIYTLVIIFVIFSLIFGNFSILIIIGAFIMLAVAIICSIIFIIIGTINAYNGEIYKYPLTISFIK